MEDSFHKNNDLMITVADFRDPYHAHLVAGYLEAAGLHVEIVDENTINANWIISQAIGGVKIKVKKSDLNQARAVLNQVEEFRKRDTQHLIHDKCPSCGSEDITSTRYSKWSVISAFLFLLPFFWPGRRWKCKSCGNTWK